MQITKQYRTETAHRLHLHKGRCRFIHGHSYLWEITVQGTVNDEGMVIDFKDLKTVVDKVLDPFDHAIVLSDKDPMVSILDGFIETKERIIIFPYIPTAENFAMYVGNRLVANGIPVVQVICWETVNSQATWVTNDYCKRNI